MKVHRAREIDIASRHETVCHGREYQVALIPLDLRAEPQVAQLREGPLVTSEHTGHVSTRLHLANGDGDVTTLVATEPCSDVRVRHAVAWSSGARVDTSREAISSRRLRLLVAADRTAGHGAPMMHIHPCPSPSHEASQDQVIHRLAGPKLIALAFELGELLVDPALRLLGLGAQPRRLGGDPVTRQGGGTSPESKPGPQDPTHLKVREV